MGITTSHGYVYPMPKKNCNASDQPFVFYHQNDGLLYQFLLHECLCAHNLLRKKPSTPLLHQIVGSLELSQEKWRAPKGHLPRLIYYSTLFFSHFNQTLMSDTRHLKERLGLLYQEALFNMELMNDNKPELKKLYSILKKEIGAFFKILLKEVPQYKENPAVLYFLLRNQKQIDAIYRQSFTKEIFFMLFPGGLEQAHSFLAERFANKGFNRLLSQISELLQQL